MSSLLQILAEPGVDQTLEVLMTSSEASFERNDLENIFLDHGAHSPDHLFDHLLYSNVFQAIGDRFGLSQNGRKLSLLLHAINGADLNDVFQRIRRIDGYDPAYKLIQHGMTTYFFKSLLDKPGFNSLYICSPWINPTDKQARNLLYAASMQERTNCMPEIIIITRPQKDHPKGTENGLETFRKLNAKIFYNKKVHSKLYIREPDIKGGVLLAIVGSQNLTRSNMLELGILIKGDDQIVNQLITHFLDLCNSSEEE
ncbi:MAG: hypothetical protein OXS40_10630 [Gammaproteobacteria bacterium]|nr:hypothetical protein [Gammaproteobacteria bacterium]